MAYGNNRRRSAIGIAAKMAGCRRQQQRRISAAACQLFNVAAKPLKAISGIWRRNVAAWRISSGINGGVIFSVTAKAMSGGDISGSVAWR
jgi:hypothetical protein